MYSTTLTVALATFAAQAEAFFGTAHLLVARRAEAILEEQNPDVLQAALDEMKPLQKYYSSLTKDEGSHPFTECAPFADNIKGQGYSFQSGWHFINLPYLDEAGTTLDDFNFNQPDIDVVSAINDLVGFLKGEVSASQSTYLSQIADKFSYEEDQRSFALRLIVHYVGDVHQPEHATALVDSKYPKGDRGGNNEKIPSKDGVKTLHAVWDSVIYEWTGYPNLPLNSDDWSWYSSTSDELAGKFPVKESSIQADNPSAWAQESFDIAKEYVYPAFVEGQDPDQAYIEAAKPICEERIMFGGARLAALMVDIYGGNSVKAFLQ